MAKEAEKSVTEEKVTDELLESAVGETEGKVEEKKETQVQEQTAQTKTEEVDPAEHKIRSWVGRKMKPLEDQIGTVNQTLQQILERLEQPQRGQQIQDEEDAIPEVITTPQDVLKVLKASQKQSMGQRQKYEMGYINQLKTLAPLNQELHEDIIKEMMTNFNVKHSENPIYDARLNYSEAKAAVLAKKTAKPKDTKPNVLGEKTDTSTNLSVESRSSSTPAPKIDLDDDAKDFLKRVGLDEKWAQEALKGETPIHLARRK